MTVAMRGDGQPKDIGGDALVLTAFKGELGPAAREIDGLLNDELESLVASGEFSGRLGETAVVPSNGAVNARRVVLLGLGERTVLDSYRLHNAYSFAGRELRRRRLQRAVLAADASLAGGAAVDAPALLRAMVTGLLVANFDAGVRTAEAERTPPITDVVVVGF